MDHAISLGALSSSPSSLQPSSALVSALPPLYKFTPPAPFASSSVTTTPSFTTTTSTAFPLLQLTYSARGNLDPPSNASATRKKAVIVWFRNDLRVHDNEALLIANQESMAVLPVYCFDPRHFRNASAECDVTAPFRVKFLLECVSNLRDNLRAKGSDLILRVGKPEEVLVRLAKAIGADGLYVHREVSGDEIDCEAKVSLALRAEGVDMKYFWGSTLLHMDDLPFKLEDMPCNYSEFLERVQHVNARKTLETPKWLIRLPQGVLPGDIPTPQDLGFGPLQTQDQEFPKLSVRTSERNGGSELEWILNLFYRFNRGGITKDKEGHKLVVPSLIGGEMEALRRLTSFLVDGTRQWSNKFGNADSGNTLHASNFYSQISPWLAMGCLSPRQIFADLNIKEKIVVSASAGSLANDNGPNCLIFELLWRDFFRFITKKFATCNQDSEAFAAAASPAVAPV